MNVIVNEVLSSLPMTEQAMDLIMMLYNEDKARGHRITKGEYAYEGGGSGAEYHIPVSGTRQEQDYTEILATIPDDDNGRLIAPSIELVKFFNGEEKATFDLWKMTSWNKIVLFLSMVMNTPPIDGTFVYGKDGDVYAVSGLTVNVSPF